MGLRAQDKSELCGGKSPEAQAGSRGVGGPLPPCDLRPRGWVSGGEVKWGELVFNSILERRGVSWEQRGPTEAWGRGPEGR